VGHVAKYFTSLLRAQPPFYPYKRPIIAVKAVEGRNGEGVTPLPSQLDAMGERHKLPVGVWSRAPAANDFGGVACAILCDFTHVSLLVHLTAA